MKKGMILLAVAGMFAFSCANESGGETVDSGVVAKNESAAKDATNTLDAAATQVKKVGDNSPERNDPKTIMTFAAMDHDFGNIMQDTENEHVFKFTNSGTSPLIIYTAKGSCGCTVPQYPKDPIAPGEEGEIKVVYKPGKQKNKQTKYVTITANTEPEQTKLKITAEVAEAMTGG